MASVCARENVPHTPDVLTTVYDALHGDLRGCLTTLQAVFHMYGDVRENLLHEQLGSVDDALWARVAALKGVSEVHTLVEELYNNGTSVHKLLHALTEWSLAACTPTQIRTIAPVLSRMERQCLFQVDNRLLLLELVFMVWKVLSTTSTTGIDHSLID